MDEIFYGDLQTDVVLSQEDADRIVQSLWQFPSLRADVILLLERTGADLDPQQPLWRQKNKVLRPFPALWESWERIERAIYHFAEAQQERCRSCQGEGCSDSCKCQVSQSHDETSLQAQQDEKRQKIR